MQDDTKEIRGTLCMMMEILIPQRQSPLSNSSATNQDTTNMQITPVNPSNFYPFRTGEASQIRPAP